MLLSLDTDHGSENVSVKKALKMMLLLELIDSDPVLHIMSAIAVHLSTLFSDG